MQEGQQYWAFPFNKGSLIYPIVEFRVERRVWKHDGGSFGSVEESDKINEREKDRGFVAQTGKTFKSELLKY